MHKRYDLHGYHFLVHDCGNVWGPSYDHHLQQTCFKILAPEHGEKLKEKISSGEATWVVDYP